jgi:hypothetical protein
MSARDSPVKGLAPTQEGERQSDDDRTFVQFTTQGDTEMSETYFPSQNGNPQDNGFPPIGQQRSFNYDQPARDQAFGPAYGNPGSPPGYPSQPATGAGSVKRLAPGLNAVLVVLTILTLALGGYSFVTHGSLGDARTEARSTQEDLAKAKQQLADKSQQAETARSCATLLQEAWDAALKNDDIPATQAALDKAGKTCQPVFAKAK